MFIACFIGSKLTRYVPLACRVNAPWSLKKLNRIMFDIVALADGEAVAAELDPGLRQRDAQFLVERVQPLGPVHPHHEHLTMALRLDHCHS